ncbi:MAG: HD domain-containing protein [Candidatus Brocadia sp.]|nr:HD domain-containing protein [Candidatus Brocadia sp.]
MAGQSQKYHKQCDFNEEGNEPIIDRMRRIKINSVVPGMVLGKTIYGYNYEVLLNKGVTLTSAYINLLKNRGFVRIYIDDDETADIVLHDPISDKIRIMSVRDIFKTYKVTQSATTNIKAENTESIIKCINTPKIKKSFQESQAFEQLCNGIHYFIDEIMKQDSMSGLNSSKSVDNYTYEHSVDTAVISIIIGKKLLLSREKLVQIAIGEFLHDIGKIFIDEKIINKPGKLTAEEFNAIKYHPTYGYELLKDIHSIGTVVAHIPYQHHERQDGRGYPRGLRGTNKLDDKGVAFTDREKLIMFAEIAALSDVYDACSSDRPYRPGLPPDMVYELIKNGAGTQFNKELVDCFLSVVPKYPVGCEIRIKNGNYMNFTGVISSLNTRQMAKPKVKLLADNMKNKISPVEIDFSSEGIGMEMECIW